MRTHLNVLAALTTDETDGSTRYEFTLRGIGDQPDSPIVERHFIVDVPHVESEDTDVWVLNSEVAVGDTPADGFATFTPITSED